VDGAGVHTRFRDGTVVLPAGTDAPDGPRGLVGRTRGTHRARGPDRSRRAGRTAPGARAGPLPARGPERRHGRPGAAVGPAGPGASHPHVRETGDTGANRAGAPGIPPPAAPLPRSVEEIP
jgi:hypothetical protein